MCGWRGELGPLPSPEQRGLDRQALPSKTVNSFIDSKNANPSPPAGRRKRGHPYRGTLGVLTENSDPRKGIGLRGEVAVSAQRPP